MKKIGIAILGLGVVGSGTYEVLTKNREFYQKTQGVDLVVESVLELDRSRALELGVAEDKIASNIAEVICNSEVDIVIEAIGGIETAREFVLAALNVGKTVVTSNKELVCKFYHELERAAKKHNAGLYFEASCVGGVPIVRTLLDGVQSNKIVSMTGIINGTTNYILTRMTRAGLTYEAALREAQRLGYAEADPTADVEGYDAAYKLSILASLAFHTKVPLTKIFREGIGGVSVEDIEAGRLLGYRLKLLAVGKQTDEGIEVRVHPAFVREEHPLASVNGNFNAVCLTGDSVGEVMLYGKGAGSLPTASAIVSDVLYAASVSENRYSTFRNTASAEKGVKFVNDFTSAYYLRLTVTDQSGVLAKIASIFGKNHVSIVELLQKTGSSEHEKTVTIFTHETRELSVRGAVAKINASGIAKVESVLRVLS